MTGIPNVTHADPCTCAKCNTKRNRILAFGAIRRAASIAREWETRADDVGLDIAHGGEGWTEFTTVADEIRYAIRRALGTDEPQASNCAEMQNLVRTHEIPNTGKVGKIGKRGTS